jgi:hypothetical protein
MISQQTQTAIEAIAQARGGFYSMSALRHRGWTQKQIEALGEEDLLAPNPHYANGHMMRLFDVNRVHAVESEMQRHTQAAA